MNETSGMELILAEKLDPVAIFNDGGMGEILTGIKSRVDSVVADVKTPEGQQEIKSTAYKISRSKTLLDNIGKELVSDWKSKAKKVDAVRKEARDFLDNLRDEFRQPLTELEDEEKRKEEKRIADIKEKLDNLRNINIPDTQEGIRTVIDRINENLEITPDIYFEFTSEAETIKAEKLTAAQTALERREKLDKEDAERKAEEALLAEERKKQEEEAAKIRLEQEKIEAEKKKIAEEKARIEREEFERKAKEDAKIKAEKDAKEKAEREEQERTAQESAVAAEKERQAALLPDKEKLFLFADEIQKVTAKNLSVKSKAARILFEEVVKLIMDLEEDFRDKIESL